MNGLKHGSGIWKGSKGDSYLGEWKAGKPDGYGVYTWVNGIILLYYYIIILLLILIGDRYEGQFKDCLKSGYG